MPLLNLSFASGESSLQVREFTTEEGVSALFTAYVVARSPDPSLDLESLVGQSAVLEVHPGYANVLFEGARIFSGIVSFIEQAQAEESDRGLSTYHLRIVPRLWLLTQRVNHRIFQHLAIPDIVDALLDAFAVEHTWKIDRGSYPKLEYKVQYEESDYVFLSRLLEEAGIAFTFDDSDGKGSVLVLGDALHQGTTRAGPPILYVDNPNETAEKEFVTRVRLSHEVRPGAHTIRDDDFRRPAFPLFGDAPKAHSPEDFYEQYHYRPGAFLVEGGAGGDTPVADDQDVGRHQEAFGDDLAERSLSGERMGKRGIAFGANVVDLRPGTLFSIAGHVHPELGAPLLVTAFTIQGSTQGVAWSMTGRAVFVDVPYRPRRSVPRPQVFGVQSATVVGPADQEIYTDEFGRVRVQLPWDRDGAGDDHSSCWIRVNQGWGGQGYGMMLIPRVGQEVLVAFLEGDPDRPIILGRLYNRTNPVPYRLPIHKTVSAWHSHSSPDSAGFNEIKYEDLAGEELLYFRAQKNQRTLVKHDETITVQNDRDKHVFINETDTTVANRTEVTGVNRVEMSWVRKTTFIAGNRAKLIAGNETERTDGRRLLKVGVDLHHVVKGKKRVLVQEDTHLHVKGKRSERIDGTQSLTLLIDQFEDVEGSAALSAGNEIHFDSMDKLCGEAADVTFKGPGGFIRIDASGVTISGTLVEINVGGSAGQGRGSKPELPDLPNEAKVTLPVNPSAKVNQEFHSDLGAKDSNKSTGTRGFTGPLALAAPPVRRVYAQGAQRGGAVARPRGGPRAPASVERLAPQRARGAAGDGGQPQAAAGRVARLGQGQRATCPRPACPPGRATISGPWPGRGRRRASGTRWSAGSAPAPTPPAEGYATGTSPADVGWQNAHGKCSRHHRDARRSQDHPPPLSRRPQDLTPRDPRGVVMDKQETELDAAERAEVEAAVVVYLGAGKRWRREDYRIEHRGTRDDGRRCVVWAVHADDEAGVAPGGEVAPALDRSRLQEGREGAGVHVIPRHRGPDQRA